MIKCDVCGKFVSYDSLEKGEARHIMITPDSAYSSEEYETLCKKHNVKEKKMADFVHIGSHIIQKTDVKCISKHIDSAGGSTIFIRLYDGTLIGVKFYSLSELTLTFNRLIKDLT